ncbi:bifunctional phosphoglucose/phosphomannose isomerase [Candidatus Poribacteria bacterium]|nr:bifunctional phosphoglucose/phosphomannose isomerase [Candidatus Poribacteria bacterium]
MSLDSLRVLDEGKMFAILVSLKDHWDRALAIGDEAQLPDSLRGARNIVWVGMGGSAMGGSLVESALNSALSVPLTVVRDYQLPGHVSRDTLVVAASYSGDTEETISGLRDAIRREARVICLTSGGALADAARRQGLGFITIPGGMMPRCGVLYLFGPMVRALSRLEYVDGEAVDAAVDEAGSVIRDAVEECQRPESVAYRLAEAMHGRLPIIYAPQSMEAVALRWRGQINENAKSFAHCHTIPEMNHNEIEGWCHPSDILERAHVVFLRDDHEPDAIRRRIDVTRDLIRPLARGVTEVRARGESLMARLMSHLVFADFTSYYLALRNGVDPTPVDRIKAFKQALAAQAG